MNYLDATTVCLFFILRASNTLCQYTSGNDASSTSTPLPTAFSGTPIGGSNPFRPETVKPETPYSRALFPLRNRQPFENPFPTQQTYPYGVNPVPYNNNPMTDYPRQQSLFNRLAMLLPHNSGYGPGLFNRSPYYPVGGGYSGDPAVQSYYPSYQQPTNYPPDSAYYNKDCSPSVAPSFVPQTEDLRINPFIYSGQFGKVPYLTGEHQHPFSKPLFQPSNVYSSDTSYPSSGSTRY